jgi:hypothetical protein
MVLEMLEMDAASGSTYLLSVGVKPSEELFSSVLFAILTQPRWFCRFCLGSSALGAMKSFFQEGS